MGGLDIIVGQGLLGMTAMTDEISNLACPAGVVSECHKNQGT
jgi:hypothetical protein